MPTYYVNDQGYQRYVHNRQYWVRYTNGGPGSTDPCSYSHWLKLPEKSITKITGRGFCRMGGKAFVLQTRSGLVEGDDVIHEEKDASDLNGDGRAIPANVHSAPMGDGLLLWAEDSAGRRCRSATCPAGR